MSGSSVDGLDIAHCTFEEIGGKWSFQLNATACIPFNEYWNKTLHNITTLSAKDLLLAHTAFGHWMGQAILQFIDQHHLHHKVHLIASHGHTVFHEPALGMTFQLGEGAAIAATTKLPVVNDLRNMDIALGGQGAPIVPIGEKLFWNEYAYFLNIGGISNITINKDGEHIAFDVCPANRVLNLLCSELGKTYDEGGKEAAKGKINYDLLDELNDLPYYKKPFPKSLSNEYGVDTVFSLIQKYAITIQDKLHTYCEHIAMQLSDVCHEVTGEQNDKMLVTGGGALNTFLIEKIQHHLMIKRIDVDIPTADLIEYKEALIMALIGVLRWREEVNVLSSVTGAKRNSVGGALWMGQE